MSEIEYMKECMARDLVVMLVDEQKMSLHGALDALYLRLKNRLAQIFQQVSTHWHTTD